MKEDTLRTASGQETKSVETTWYNLLEAIGVPAETISNPDSQLSDLFVITPLSDDGSSLFKSKRGKNLLPWKGVCHKGETVFNACDVTEIGTAVNSLGQLIRGPSCAPG